jgi:hypothetical protein
VCVERGGRGEKVDAALCFICQREGEREAQSLNVLYFGCCNFTETHGGKTDQFQSVPYSVES